jgi:carboxyl-terminal processing protease
MKRIVEFMKRNYKVILVITALSAVLWSFIPTEKKSDPEKDKLLLELLTMVLERGHYSPVAIDDAFSKKVYAKYLDGIDPTKRFFLQSDIEEFSKYEMQIDDMIKNKDLTFFNLTNSRLLKRMKESRAIYEEILDEPFDFKINESINVDYEKLSSQTQEGDKTKTIKERVKIAREIQNKRFKNLALLFLLHSTFDIQHSVFDISSFVLRI